MDVSFDSILSFLSSLPWFKNAMGVVSLIFFILLCGIVLRYLRKKYAEPTTQDKEEDVKELQELFNNLNGDAHLKTELLRVLNIINVNFSRALESGSLENYLSLKPKLFDFCLFSAVSIITKSKTNTHRIALFVEDTVEHKLKIYYGQGFSAEGTENLRLDLIDSVAGRVYRTGEPYFSGDLSNDGNIFKKNPKSSKNYNSLMCVPIKCDKMVLGVLSMDGKDHNSFSKDDLDYLNYFANAITHLFLIEKMLTMEGDNNEYSSKIKRQEQIS